MEIINDMKENGYSHFQVPDFIQPINRDDVCSVTGITEIN
jgi:hypothetical protein